MSPELLNSCGIHCFGSATWGDALVGLTALLASLALVLAVRR